MAGHFHARQSDPLAKVAAALAREMSKARLAAHGGRQ
jgi:hypothetical protein